LVKVFVHPWVLFFQEKYNIRREVDSEGDLTSSSEDLEEELSD
jgi:hypothetical protein